MANQILDVGSISVMRLWAVSTAVSTASRQQQCPSKWCNSRGSAPHRTGVWQVVGGITRPCDFRRGRRSAAIPDGTTTDGRRTSCKEIGPYDRAQELLRRGHNYLDDNGDREACESLR